MDNVNKYRKYVDTLFEYDSNRNFSNTMVENLINVLPHDFSLGCIIGASGTGKSTICKKLTDNNYKLAKKGNKLWESTPIIEQIDDDPQNAVEKLLACGLCSVPQWFLKYCDLSDGQKKRADLCRNLENYTIFDEFSSKLDRISAKNLSRNLHKFIKNTGLKNIIISTPFYDVLNWIQPDWVYYTSNNEFINLLKFDTLNKNWIFFEVEDVKNIDINTGTENKIYLSISSSKRWDKYKNHHYLSSDICNNCHYYELHIICENVIRDIGYIAVSPLPHTIKAKREHRLVILPEAQGIGIGSSVSEYMGKKYRDLGYRYYAKTTHPKLGNYRNKTKNLWKPTSTNGKIRNNKGLGNNWDQKSRTYYSHEFIGSNLHQDYFNDDQQDQKVTIDNLNHEIADWTPCTLIGTIKETSSGFTTRFNHEKKLFLFSEYNSDKISTFSAAQKYLQYLNIENKKSNLYYFNGENVHIRILNGPEICFDKKLFENIKHFRLFVRQDNRNNRVFYFQNKKRIYLDSLNINYTIINTDWE